MKLTLTHVVILIILALSLAAPLAADPFEDADTAYVRGDYATAMRLFRPLADKGNPAAQFILGSMYNKGEGVPQNLVEGLRWYLKAADQGHAEAQFRLGFIYDQGVGAPQDYAEAVKWYRKAADQGNADAQQSLGFMYSRGEGVPQNDTEAVKWYLRAANQGNAGAESFLATMYRDGRGVPRNNVEAHKWFNLAVSRLSPTDETTAEFRKLAEQGRDLVAAMMTPAQIVEAQKLAREWKPKSER